MPLGRRRPLNGWEEKTLSPTQVDDVAPDFQWAVTFPPDHFQPVRSPASNDPQKMSGAGTSKVELVIKGSPRPM